MIAEHYDGTKNHKLFNQFFHGSDCSNQTSITSVESKDILKQMHCRIGLNKKAKNDKRRVLGPCVTFVLNFFPCFFLFFVLFISDSIISLCALTKSLLLCCGFTTNLLYNKTN